MAVAVAAVGLVGLVRVVGGGAGGQLLCQHVQLVVQRRAVEGQLGFEVLIAQVHVLGPAFGVAHIETVGAWVLWKEKYIKNMRLVCCRCMCLGQP